MSRTDRRTFIKLAGSSAFIASLPPGLARALAIPAHRRTGTIADIEHIVILTQENRSFDHYFGSLRGVRGFADPRAVRLPSGLSVWHQPNGSGYLLPFRPYNDMGMRFLPDPPHGWNDGHAAWNGGQFDRWVPNKGVDTMTYHTRHDIPYHYALADAFTICDAYHCSVMGPTDPNRYHMWTGWVGNDGNAGGPVITNAEAGYDWSTYPERLQRAGVTWKVYQDVGDGLDAAGFWGWTGDPFIGNYGDNSLLYFHQFQNAAPGTPLADGGRTGTNIKAQGRNPDRLVDIFREDVMANRLPQVSWIAAPESYTEHPNWRVNEIYASGGGHPTGPYGLGVRVPLIVISPWSKGGWVNSEVFDHTSLVKFIEARFADDHPDLIESNITPWRRAVVGDLTGAFDFATPDGWRLVDLPDTAAFKPQQLVGHPNDAIVPPPQQQMPAQERGVRPARALPYALHATGAVQTADGSLRIDFGNTGKAAAVFHVRSAQPAHDPRSYTVGPGAALSGLWTVAADGDTDYDVSVYGPNGFLRRFKGSVAPNRTRLSVHTGYDEQTNRITLTMANRGSYPVTLDVVNAYSGQTVNETVAPGASAVRRWSLARFDGWYDFTITARYEPDFASEVAGHLETGKDSISDPAMGGRDSQITTP